MSDKKRVSPLHINNEEFRKLGHKVIDAIAEYFDKLEELPVTRGLSPSEIQKTFPQKELPDKGEPLDEIIDRNIALLVDNSLHIGHPRFWGYICGSSIPVTVLADLIGSAFNPNLGGYVISPMATEIEKQTILWLAQFVGYPEDCGGLLVSGGNMANLVALWTARKAKSDWDVRKKGMQKKMTVYASAATHTWLQKATDLSGLGTDQIRWIEVDESEKMKINKLEIAILEDLEKAHQPFMVTANAGSVSTGAVDPLKEIRKICDKYDLWMHADGAYGGLAAVLPEADPDLKDIRLADSLAIDPHKWMYTSLEAGCVLVRDAALLREAFSYKPVYYDHEDHESQVDYHEYGPQNSRSFKALKVWMALQQVGRSGYIESIRQDIELARYFYNLLDQYEELEPHSHSLSIVTFRYVPKNMDPADRATAIPLNDLNEKIQKRIQKEGKAFISNAVIHGAYLLRICIVNHRSSYRDLDTLPEIVIEAGRKEIGE